MSALERTSGSLLDDPGEDLVVARGDDEANESRNERLGWETKMSMSP